MTKRSRSRKSAAPATNTVDERQLLEAIMAVILQYKAACRRFNQRRKALGFDYGCSRMLDQIALRKSLLHLLMAEALGGGSPATA
ncbi:MAG: hypothetical protein EHM59_05610 [Betaproteobacteria bacterium]|nr:MAG: hypothetical protein EHM59_05610 [Betaproteobacteria bacterium]